MSTEIVYKEIDLHELPHIVQTARCLLIDIRTEFEQLICANPVDGAYCIPLHTEELVERPCFLEEVQQLIAAYTANPGDVSVAFVCRSGNRSQRACELMLAKTSYKNVYNVRNGLYCVDRSTTYTH